MLPCHCYSLFVSYMHAFNFFSCILLLLFLLSLLLHFLMIVSFWPFLLLCLFSHCSQYLLYSPGVRFFRVSRSQIVGSLEGRAELRSRLLSSRSSDYYPMVFWRRDAYRIVRNFTLVKFYRHCIDANGPEEVLGVGFAVFRHFLKEDISLLELCCVNFPIKN